MITEENKVVKYTHKGLLHKSRDFAKVCQKCKSVNIYTRTRRKPKYKCLYCKNEFDSPNAKLTHKTLKEQKEIVIQYSEPDE